MVLFKIAAGTEGFALPLHRNYKIAADTIFEREELILDQVRLQNAEMRRERWEARWPEIDALAALLTETSVRNGQMVFARRNAAGKLYLLIVPESAVEVVG